MSCSDLFLFEWFGSMPRWRVAVSTHVRDNDILKIDSDMAERMIWSTLKSINRYVEITDNKSWIITAFSFFLFVKLVYLEPKNYFTANGVPCIQMETVHSNHTFLANLLALLNNSIGIRHRIGGGLSRLRWIFHQCRWGLCEDSPHSWQSGKRSMSSTFMCFHYSVGTF